ncbi:hypothetical protein SEUCBS139899_006166 [Sporothrix eucalyptigena]|uniref:Thioredoxin-like fold domain-containing protein n=1 Tax=Sporothrix eucalyptigena TaxID=1812306 RepID=A0ABP0AQK0_9PEZI
MAAQNATATGPTIAPLPVVDGTAPDSPELNLPRPKPVLIVFLRQCGDPFAEKTFRQLAALSEDRPELQCIAVSQAVREVTDLWVSDIGGAWETEVVADPERTLYARWGLGLNTSWQMFNPRALYSTYALGRDEGIWSRAWGGHRKVPKPSTPADTDAAAARAKIPGQSVNGNKWQMGGAFAVDVAGGVRWVHVPTNSDDIIDFDPVLELFGMAPLPKPTKRRHSPSPSPIPDGQRTLYQTPTPRDPPSQR